MLDLSNPDVDDGEVTDSSGAVDRVEKQKELNKQRFDQRIDGLLFTKKQLEEADDDQIVMQRLEGEVLVEVKPEDRDEVIERIEQAIEDLREEKKRIDDL